MMTVIARQWARSASKADRDLQQFRDGQVLKLRYEDFVEEPMQHLERICAHCGLDMTSEMAEFVRTTVRNDRNEKWQRFHPNELSRIIPEVAEQMIRNGYEIPEEIVRADRQAIREFTPFDATQSG